MGPEQALVAILEDHDPLTALVDDRIWPQRLAQNPTLPAVTYLLVAAPRDYTHGGASGIANPRVQVNCWGANYDQAINCAGLVVAAVDAIPYPAVLAGTRVDVIFVDSQRDDFQPDRGIQRRIVDLRMWHGETPVE